MLYSRTSREAGITYAYAPGDRIPDTEDSNIKGNPGAYIYAQCSWDSLCKKALPNSPDTGLYAHPTKMRTAVGPLHISQQDPPMYS